MISSVRPARQQNAPQWLAQVLHLPDEEGHEHPESEVCSGNQKYTGSKCLTHWDLISTRGFSGRGFLRGLLVREPFVVYHDVLAEDFGILVEDECICRMHVATGSSAPNKEHHPCVFLHMDDWRCKIACVKEALEQPCEAILHAV